MAGPSAESAASHATAPIHFTARLQYPLQYPSRHPVAENQMLSLFRNPFYGRRASSKPGCRTYTPNIYNELDANRVVYSRVHDEVMAMLTGLYSGPLEEEFQAQFGHEGGARQWTHLVLSGSLSEGGVVGIEDCYLSLGRFRSNGGYAVIDME